MTTFKAGDKVRRTKRPYEGVPIGTVGEVIRQRRTNHPQDIVQVDVPGIPHESCWAEEYLELVPSPVDPLSLKPGDRFRYGKNGLLREVVSIQPPTGPTVESLCVEERFRHLPPSKSDHQKELESIILEPPAPPKEVQVTLTVEEAKAIRNVLGPRSGVSKAEFEGFYKIDTAVRNVD